MTLRIPLLTLVVCAGCYSGKVSLGTCNADTECTAKQKGSTCENHICTYPCPTICGKAEQCVNAACVAIGPEVTSVNVSPKTWVSPSQSITVTALIDGTKTGGVDSALLKITGHADIPQTEVTGTGPIKTFTFVILGSSVISTPSETPIDFQIVGVSPNNKITPTDAAGTGQLLFDGLGPKVNGVTITNGVPVGSGLNQINWFPRTATQNVDAVVSIQDGGSGVDQASLKLVLLSDNSVISTAPATCAQSTTGPDLKCHLSIPPGTVPLPSGSAQGLVRFAVAGADALGNVVIPNTAAVGIDGKPPAITFNPTYPPAYKDCNGAIGDDGTIFCGHDGSHFFRTGDAKYSLSFTASDAFASPDDIGSGVDTTRGTCAIAGTSCTVTFNPAGATFSFPADFATASLVTPQADGTATVQVSVNVKDLVGNPLATAVQVPVSVTRLKWMRTMTGKIDTLKSAPIATTAPESEVIFTGSERADALGPIASFTPDGRVLWRAGHGDVTTISNNVAYSSVTHTLYVLGDNVSSLFGYGVTAGAASSKFGCPLTDSGTTANAVGAPAIVAGATERILVADAVGRLWSLAGTPGTGCATIGNTLTNNGGTWSGLGPPTIDNGLVYIPHNVTKLSTVAFNGTVFGAITDAGSFSQAILGPVSIASNLFFANQNVPGQALSYTAAFSSRWSTNLLDKLNAAMVVSAAYAFAAPGTNDGQLHALSKADGTDAWHWPSVTTKIGNISAPTIGVDGVIYFSSDNPAQLVPLRVVSNAPLLADGWVEFKGSASQKTTSPVVDTTLDSITTEPVIDSSGTIYFGTAAGKVYALITDAGGPLVPVAGTTWPRIGYDNCNSSNTSFTCQ